MMTRVRPENAPEIVLTESYSLHFEGPAVGCLSRWTFGKRGRDSRGCFPRRVIALAILSGPKAGEWRSIVQPLGPNTFLLDEPSTGGDFGCCGLDRDWVCSRDVPR